MNRRDKNKSTSTFDDDDVEDLDLMFSTDDDEDDDLVKKKAELRLTDILKSPSLLSPLVDAFFCFVGFGMVEAMLEPHLRNEAGATQIQVAWTFFILGTSYLIFMPLIGFVSLESMHA